MSSALRCQTCGSNWSAGEYQPDCAECAGGALEIPCIFCEGQCGAVWRRAIDDSHFFGRGSFVQTAPCGLGVDPASIKTKKKTLGP